MNKKALSLITVAMLASIASAIDGAYLINLKDGRTRPVVLTSLGSVRNPLGMTFSVDLNLYAGMNEADRVVPGLWASVHYRLADNLNASIGPSFEFVDSRIRVSGLMVGFSLTF